MIADGIDFEQEDCILEWVSGKLEMLLLLYTFSVWLQTTQVSCLSIIGICINK